MERVYPESELARVGIDVVNPKAPLLECLNCGKQWSPETRPGGGFYRGWWRCPNRCNGGIDRAPRQK